MAYLRQSEIACYHSAPLLIIVSAQKSPARPFSCPCISENSRIGAHPKLIDPLSSPFSARFIQSPPELGLIGIMSVQGSTEQPQVTPSLALGQYQHRRAAPREGAHCLNNRSCDCQSQEEPNDLSTWELTRYQLHEHNRKIAKNNTSQAYCNGESSSSTDDDQIDDIDNQNYYFTSDNMEKSPSKPINCPRPSLAVATNESPHHHTSTERCSMSPTSPLNAGCTSFAGASPKSPTSFMGNASSPRPRANSFSWERERPTSLPGLFGENTNANAPYTAQRLASYTYGMPIAPCVCTRHHHRRSSVAIKFKNNYMDEYHDPDLMFAGDVMPTKSKYSTHDKGEVMRRPPSPIAERILKGELDSF